MSSIQTFRHGNQVLEIFHDECPDSPREWTNLGTMLCRHPNYKIGDAEYTDEAFEKAQKTAVAVMPVYMFDHSGITLSVDSEKFSEIDPQRWDWGQVGYIYATPESIKEVFGGKTPTTQEIKDILREEVNVYNQYLNGEIYGYVLSESKECSLGDEHKETVDSCWGYYDIDDIIDEVGASDWEEE